ncbi:MAG: DUF3006 domain-containing protein [Chloroflexota bacterium]|nr:MAG: DUF3006 domain-containing protein [Chloroflexota bacterium]
MKAVIDRFEEEFAVILLGEGGIKLLIPKALLPPGAKEGHWLQIEMDEGAVKNISIDEQETAEVKMRIKDKLRRLRGGASLNEDPQEDPDEGTSGDEIF